MNRLIGNLHDEETTMELAMQGTAGRRNGLAQVLATMALPMMTAAMIAGLAGCGVGLKSVATTVQGTALHGKVYGGQNPVGHAVIQLYAVKMSGYAKPAMPLITPGSVTTHSDGTFDITGDYMCPTTDTLVYLTATGGNAGYVTDNANLTLMTALGTCGNLLVTPFVEVNEITTVGSVWALAPFMSGPANVGAMPAAAQGIANAFADVHVLVDTSDGTTPGPALPTGATITANEINTLADILAACVNSAGGVAGDGSGCGMLFGAANPGGTSLTAPTDVVTAAVNMAQNPGLHVSTLYGLVVPESPFQPTEAQPNDFTLAVNFTAGAMNSPSALAADAAGNIWITNAGSNTVTELSHSGSVLSGTGFTASLNQPSAIAFDLNGVAWITNKGNNSVSRMNDGAPVGSPLNGGGLNLPSSIAFDYFGNAWIANTGTTAGTGSVSEFSSAGTAVSTDGYTGSGISNPIGIGVDPH
jgi:hypothetical protein